MTATTRQSLRIVAFVFCGIFFGCTMWSDGCSKGMTYAFALLTGFCIAACINLSDASTGSDW
jgi:hypothetical protein